LQAPGLTKVGRGVCHDRLGAVSRTCIWEESKRGRRSSEHCCVLKDVRNERRT
jgi:hypothetical protein